MNNLYSIGKVVSIGKTYIILEANYTGKIIYVPRPQDFKNDWVGKVYIYTHKTEYVEAIYGFQTFKERILFENLLAVRGVSAKVAFAMLKDGADTIIKYIVNLNTQALKQYVGVSQSMALVIANEYQDKYRNAKQLDKDLLEVE